MLTVAEAAERVGKSPETMLHWIREGRLHADTANGAVALSRAGL